MNAITFILFSIQVAVQLSRHLKVNEAETIGILRKFNIIWTVEQLYDHAFDVVAVSVD